MRRALTEGAKISGFVVENATRVKELQLSAYKLKHARSGAQLLHLAREDANNVFSVAFETAPTDSTGVPHILEHTALCGSEKFPVRDPFFKMLNRSMSSYMNAWTSSDFTMYPFATQNHVDLENLRTVYLDATFRPLLNQTDFMQEGWRLENQKFNDPETPIMFKGVVYNEMKGAFSDVGYLFCQRMQQQLMPKTTYAHVSGGDPSAITDLTHQQLVEFHRSCYHPSNAKFYTYGDYPLEKHLQVLDPLLSSFDSHTRIPPSMIPARYQQPKRITQTCPPDPLGDPEKQTKMSVSFLMNKVSDSFETFSMRILSYLLLDGQSSPFHRALIDSQIGSEYASSTGYDTTTAQASFSVGLQGIHAKDVDRVEQLIMQTFEQASREGFDPARVEAAIHQLEISTKQKTANFGMNLSHGLMSAWMHGADPIEHLQINKHVERLRQELSGDGQKEFFQRKIRQYFMENQHRLTFIMHPDSKFADELRQEEEQRLKSKVDQLTQEDRKRILEYGKTLAKLQDTKQDLSCLPCLNLDDVPRKAKCFPVQSARSSVPIQHRLTATNGLTYFRALGTVAHQQLSHDLLSHLPIFASTLTALGTSTKDAAEFDELIRLYTGGIGASTFSASDPHSTAGSQFGVLFSGQCLDRNLDRMYDLLMESILSTNYENRKKLKTVLMANASSMMNGLAESGHHYARLHAASRLSHLKHLHETMGGLTQVQALNVLSQQESLDGVVDRLKKLSELLLTQGKYRLALTCTEDVYDSNVPLVDKFVKNTGISGQSNPEDFATAESFKPQYGAKSFIALPFATNFSSKCIKTVEYTHPDSIKLQVLSSILTHHFLHREIREKGGAYGGGASYNALEGMLSFYSYRDPNPLQSIEAFKRSLEWASRTTVSDQQLKEAKLSILGQMDAPVSASSEGMSYFKQRISAEMRQQRRDALFQVSAASVSQVAQLVLDKIPEASSTVLAGADTAKPVGSEWEMIGFGQ